MTARRTLPRHSSHSLSRISAKLARPFDGTGAAKGCSQWGSLLYEPFLIAFRRSSAIVPRILSAPCSAFDTNGITPLGLVSRIPHGARGRLSYRRTECLVSLVEGYRLCAMDTHIILLESLLSLYPYIQVNIAITIAIRKYFSRQMLITA